MTVGDLLEWVGLGCAVALFTVLFAVPGLLGSLAVALLYLGQCHSAQPFPLVRRRFDP